jgi:hypothetical protein
MRAIAALARPRLIMLALVLLRPRSNSSCAGWFEPVVTEPDVVYGVPTFADQAGPSRNVMAGAGSRVLRRAAFLDTSRWTGLSPEGWPG